jgi:hypothetical protein
MADQICIGKLRDGSRCTRKAAPLSNYCEEHRPEIRRSPLRSDALYEAVLYDRLPCSTRTSRFTDTELKEILEGSEEEKE